MNKKWISLFGFFLILIFMVSCNRSGNNKPDKNTSDLQAAKPFAIVQSGENPLWFQLTDKGPIHIGAVEDSAFTCAFIPWPLALHIRFYEINNNELYLAVNRDGFMKFAAGNDGALDLYRFSGGNFQQYTIGGLVFFNAHPAALLYLDDRFLDSGESVPSPRTWTFNMKSNTSLPLDIPALEQFPSRDGWNVDTFRFAVDGYWYYRVIKRQAEEPQIRMLRSLDLTKDGKDVSLEAFQSSAPREDSTFLNYDLPVLPENFFYTGAVKLADNVIAFWEEQEDYNIGAAGFVILKR